MKADYTKALKTISGKIDNFVHLNWKVGEKAFIRKYVKPKPGVNNVQFANAMKNMSAIWKQCSTGFKNDLKMYLQQRVEYYANDEIPAQTNFAHFIKFLYSFRESNPGLDLTRVTKAELENAGIPTTVKNIVKSGYLPPIPDAEDLTNSW